MLGVWEAFKLIRLFSWIGSLCWSLCTASLSLKTIRETSAEPREQHPGTHQLVVHQPDLHVHTVLSGDENNPLTPGVNAKIRNRSPADTMWERCLVQLKTLTSCLPCCHFLNVIRVFVISSLVPDYYVVCGRLTRLQQRWTVEDRCRYLRRVLPFIRLCGKHYLHRYESTWRQDRMFH